MKYAETTLEDLACQKVRLLGGREYAGARTGGEMRVIPRRTWSMTIAAAVLTLGTALAHHSTAEFDYSKEVTINGVVKEVQWDQSALPTPGILAPPR